MKRILFSNSVSFIEYLNLKFICNLEIVIWKLANFTLTFPTKWLKITLDNLLCFIGNHDNWTFSSQPSAVSYQHKKAEG